MKNILTLTVLFLSFVMVLAVSAEDSAKSVSLSQYLADMTPNDSTQAESVKKMENSQIAWMNYCLQTASAPGNEKLLQQANDEMIAALQTVGQLEAKVWLLHLLAWTGTDREVDAIAAFLNDTNIRLADEAMRALAIIHTPKAMDALKKGTTSVTVEGRAKAIADVLAHSRPNLTVPQETDLPLAIPTLSESELKKYLAAYDTFSIDQKVRTLTSLTVRKDACLLPLAKNALTSDNPDMVQAGIYAMEKVGAPADLLALARFFGTDFASDAITVMARYPGSELNSLILNEMKKPNVAFFTTFADVVAKRNFMDALPLLLQKGSAEICPDRVIILNWAAELASASDVPQFVDGLLRTQDVKEREAIEKLISRLSQGNGSFVIQRLNRETAPVLLPLLGRMGGKASLDKLRAIMTDANQKEIAAWALRGLCNWPNAEVADDLTNCIKNQEIPESLRVAALRAYVRVMTLPDDIIGIQATIDQRLTALRQAMTWSTDRKEKELVLRRSAAVRDPKSLAFIMEFADQPELEPFVFDSILDLAHHDFLRKAAPDAFKSALDRILTRCQDGQKKDRARRYRDAIK